jgi:hypothetical protein
MGQVQVVMGRGQCEVIQEIGCFAARLPFAGATVYEFGPGKGVDLHEPGARRLAQILHGATFGPTFEILEEGRPQARYGLLTNQAKVRMQEFGTPRVETRAQREDSLMR